MPPLSASLMLAIHDVLGTLPTVEAKLPLEDALRLAMKATQDHWLVTEEEDQFKAAIGAAMLYFGAGSAEHQRIEAEMHSLNQFSVILAGAALGMDVGLADIVPSDAKPIGLIGMWREELKRRKAGDSTK